MLLGVAMLASTGTARAAGFDPTHADVIGNAYGGSGSVTINLPPTPKTVVKVPELALEQTQYCALPVDGQTYETKLDPPRLMRVFAGTEPL